MKNSYIAEFLGTLALATIVTLSVSGAYSIGTPILAALTLGLFVYTVGHISGTHINPAVTAGLWSVKKIATNDAVMYIIAQLIAGGCAYALLQFIHPGFSVMNGMTMHDFWGELVGTAVFTFGIAAVVSGKVPAQFSGMVVGGSLLLGISFASVIGAAGALNPAVAIALGLWNPVYLIAPILGSAIGFHVYKQID
jgi:glycerol uptake facilitator-like aquaporin